MASGVPKGTPAVMTTVSPGPATSSSAAAATALRTISLKSRIMPKRWWYFESNFDYLRSPLTGVYRDLRATARPADGASGQTNLRASSRSKT